MALPHHERGQDEVKLLTFWASPFPMRLKMALELKGVHYEQLQEDMHNKSQLLLESNPIYKKIPVLIHNGKALSESAIILEYIEEVWPSEKLLPADPYDRAVMRFWADYVDKKFFPTAFSIVFTVGEAQEKAKLEVMECLGTLENALSTLNPTKPPFFGGESVNYVDIMMGPFVAWSHAIEMTGDFDMSIYEKFPRLYEWMEALAAHTALNKCLPDADKIADFAVMVRKQRIGGESPATELKDHK